MLIKVYVQSAQGNPLDPTTPARGRLLVKKGGAKVVARLPFSIRLRDREMGYTTQVTLGVDSGYSKVGFSAVAEKEELLTGELVLRNDMSKKLEQRRNYRRNRRSRNTRYRAPRFDNRKREQDWLAPSLRHKKQAHITLIDTIKTLVPVSRTELEVATFDTQLLQNPEISGVEYQQGTLQGYHIREYLLEKWGRKCVYCGKTGVPLQVEHIIPRSRGGSDRVLNLTLSCERCNQHKGDRTATEFGHPEIHRQAKASLKSAAFMNLVRWQLVDQLECNHTYGYLTKQRRLEVGLAKSHPNDAFIIAGGRQQTRCRPFMVMQPRRNNRSIQMNRKGYGRNIRTQRYALQPHDLISYEGQRCQVKGIFNRGRWVRLKTPTGATVNTQVKHVKLVRYGSGLQFNCPY
ncbi:RNA-guided endonuclease IscB [Candidatus Borrarchaeum sp.]|uniref:RNA-guided endonuclease IscB n=1 Tax=Candidatus Borrarchaeum sp. TaxID=2846742 RepID=UPI00257B267B|nr:RNA-guided endonuclease IscB [Candidatus Borrarchaeum sp.]